MAGGGAAAKQERTDREHQDMKKDQEKRSAVRRSRAEEGDEGGKLGRGGSGGGIRKRAT
jgi:hypothetical protein